MRLKTVHRHGETSEIGSFTLCGQKCDVHRDNWFACALPDDQKRPLASDRHWCGRCDAVAATIARRGSHDQHSEAPVQISGKVDVGGSPAAPRRFTDPDKEKPNE